jgi:hypothetical protein
MSEHSTGRAWWETCNLCIGIWRLQPAEHLPTCWQSTVSNVIKSSSNVRRPACCRCRKLRSCSCTTCNKQQQGTQWFSAYWHSCSIALAMSRATRSALQTCSFDSGVGQCRIGTAVSQFKLMASKQGHALAPSVTGPDNHSQHSCALGCNISAWVYAHCTSDCAGC